MAYCVSRGVLALYSFSVSRGELALYSFSVSRGVLALYSFSVSRGVLALYSFSVSRGVLALYSFNVSRGVLALYSFSVSRGVLALYSRRCSHSRFLSCCRPVFTIVCQGKGSLWLFRRFLLGKILFSSAVTSSSFRHPTPARPDLSSLLSLSLYKTTTVQPFQ